MKSPAFRSGLIASLAFLASIAAITAAQEKGGFRPALVGNGPKSLVNLIDTGKLMCEGQQDAEKNRRNVFHARIVALASLIMAPKRKRSLR